MKKSTPQDPFDVLKAKNGNVELSVGNESKVNISEIDMNPQYHPKNEDFADIDIFANKKRAMQKINDEVLVAYDQAGEHIPAEAFGTEKKLLKGLGDSVAEPSLIISEDSTNQIHKQD